jgi:hypothetical protein
MINANVLLDAECVINNLYSQRLISMRDWQNRHPSDQNYSIFFPNPNDLVSDIVIHITKRSGRYFVLRSLVDVLSYRHQFNPDRIYTECAVAA